MALMALSLLLSCNYIWNASQNGNIVTELFTALRIRRKDGESFR